MRPKKSEHVRDFQLVDPAVTQPLAASQQRVETCAVSGREQTGPRRSVYVPLVRFSYFVRYQEQESRAAARKPRDAASVLFR